MKEKIKEYKRAAFEQKQTTERQGAVLREILEEIREYVDSTGYTGLKVHAEYLCVSFDIEKSNYFSLYLGDTSLMHEKKEKILSSISKYALEEERRKTEQKAIQKAVEEFNGDEVIA